VDYRLSSPTHVIHPVFRFRNFESLSLYYKRCSLMEYAVPVFQNCMRCRWPRGLRQLACWNCGFEFRRRRECLSLVSLVCCSGRGLCVGLITRPGETYWVCVCVCPVSVIRCYIKTIHPQWVGTRGGTKQIVYDKLYLTLTQGRCYGDIAFHIYDTDCQGRFLSEDGIFSKYFPID